MRAPRGTRDAVSKSSSIKIKILLLVLVLGGLMWYTGEMNPITAVKTVLPPGVVGTVTDLLQQAVNIVEPLLQKVLSLVS